MKAFFFFAVYLIDDVLASLDAHVSKHIVKHCILDLLKDRTRILVTESRTLFYYSNQILHIERGTVTTSDFALGSFESDHFESESSSSSSEMNTPINFELNSDELVDSNRSMFQVIYFFSSIQFNSSERNCKSVDCLQEIKETGSLSSRVLAAYWKAWGPSFGLIVVLSLVLMQATRNLSDTWLAHWIQNTDTSNASATLAQPVSNHIQTKLNSDDTKHNFMCFLKQVAHFGNISECASDILSTNLTIGSTDVSPNTYYLAIYVVIAIFNATIALIRAFAFAYAGVKAAKFIHDRLLNSVIYVRIQYYSRIVKLY